MAVSNAESRRTKALRNRLDIANTIGLILCEIEYHDDEFVQFDDLLKHSPPENLFAHCGSGWEVVLKCKQLLGTYRVECEKHPEIAAEIRIEVQAFSFRLQAFTSNLLDATDRLGC